MRKRTVFSWPFRAALYPANHIRWKIIAPYAALTLVLAVAGTYLVSRLVGQSLDERFNNQLVEAGRVASDSLVRRERQHLEAVRAIAFTDGVVAATSASDEAALSRLVEPLAANQGLERIEVLDAGGQRFFGGQLSDDGGLAYTPLFDDPDRTSWRLVQRVLAHEEDSLGDKYTEIVPTANGHVLYTAGPILEGERVAGVVLVGTPLTSFLAGAKAEALADITLYGADGQPIATTFPAEDSDGEVDLATDPEATAGDESLLREHRTLYGRDFDLLYGEMAIRGEPVALYSVGLPSSFIFNAQAATQARMAVLFTIATLATLFVGWLIARSLTSPLFKLVTAANAVTGGDLSARSGVGGGDEIGALGRAFDAMTERLQRQHLATVRALTSAIDARDPYTMGHSLRVGQLSVALGVDLGLESRQIQHLEIGGYLHDIGKIGVRDAVLLKPGALTPEERQAIERHPRIGLDILEAVELAPEVLEFVGGHHEKLDGKGYPEHLHAEQLSIIARIAAVADIYDAVTTDRPYRAGMSPEKAMEILGKECAAGQLDRRVIDAMARVLPAWELRRRSEPALRGFQIDSVEHEADDQRAA